MVGRWNVGMMEFGYQKPKALLLVQDRFAEARGKGLFAFSLKSTAGGRSSNLYQGKILIHEPILPVFHYSNTPDETFHQSNSQTDFVQEQQLPPLTHDTPAGFSLDWLGERVIFY
jgi:hypothetical protein